MSVDTLEDAEKAIAAIEELGWRRPPWGEFADDNFVWDGDTRGGYRARHVHLVDPSGRLSVEFQLVPKEVAEQQKKSHGLYEVIRDESKPAEERKAAAAELKVLLDTAWAKFAERTGATDPNADGADGGPPSGVHPLAPTAQGSERLPSAGTFQEGEATEAPKSTKIVRDLQEVLHKQLQGVKLTEGRIPKRGIFARALAVVDPRAQVVKSVSLSDVPAIGHEYGHLMQKLLLGSSAEGGIDNATIAKLPGAVRGELQDLGKGISDESLSEGWAEFWRRYLDNASALEAEASNALEYIDEKLDSFPAVRNAWIDAREQWKLHRDASPQARLRSHISIGESDAEAMSIKDRWMRFRTNILDDYEPIRKVVADVRQRTRDPLELEEDAETLARISRSTGIADMFVGEKVGDRWVGGQVDFSTLDLSGKSFAEILDPVQDKLDDFRDYIVARRAQELHKRDILTGIRNQDADWTVKTLEERYGEDFKPAFENLLEYNDSLLQYLADSGVIAEGSLEKIREFNKNYVPFYRVKEGTKGLGGGSGFGTLWSPVKRLKGSGRDIIDPLESILKNTYGYIKLAQKQQVSTALANLAKKEGVGDLLEKLVTPMRGQQFTVGEVSKDLKDAVPGLEQLLEQLESVGVDPSEELLAVFRPGDYLGKPNTISVLKDGKRQWFEVDTELYKALEGLNTEQLDAWVGVMMKPARSLRAGATLAPGFLLVNITRDQLVAGVQSEYGYVPFVDYGRGLFEVIRKGKRYEDFMVSGATQSSLAELDRDSQQRNLRKLVDGGGLENVLKDPLDILRALSQLSEQGTRMGEYMRARKSLGDTKSAKVYSGLAAREVTTDFSRHGAKTLALIVLGPPGAGKTTAAIAELKREQGALEVDSDIVKERLPEPARSVFECASVVVRLGGNQGSAAISWGGAGPQSRASGSGRVHSTIGRRAVRSRRHR